MNKTQTTVLALGIAAFLSFLSTANASSDIPLNDQEKKLIDRGEIVVRELSTTGQAGRTFEAIGLINTDRATLVQVLTDYENYPEFMPNVSRVEIIERQGNESVLNYTLRLPLGKVKKYRMKISWAEPYNQCSRIEWQLQKWPELKPEETIRDTTGYWLIREKTKSCTLVMYHLYADPGPVPFGLGWIVDLLSKDSVPKTLLQTRSHTEEHLSEESSQAAIAP